MQQNNQKEIILIKSLGTEYPTPTSKRKRHYSLYLCHCGNEFKSNTDNVKSGKVSSCGCQIKIPSPLGKKDVLLSKHRLYKTWSGMRQRCENPNNDRYIDYGGAGITVCESWKKSINFINDMSSTFVEGYTLDRIDNAKGYSKDNCRWSSAETQARHTRILSKANTTGFRGVCFCAKAKACRAQIKISSKHIHLGTFTNPYDGAIIYDNYITSNNLQHTKNFS